MKIFNIAIAIIILVLVWTAAFAQTRFQEPPGNVGQQGESRFAPDQGPGAPPSPERREQVRKKIEAIRVWRMTEELDLDEKTAAKFLPAISALSHQRNELARENLETMRELRIYLRSGKPDEKEIRNALDRLEKIHRELTNIREKEISAAKAHLTFEQQAKYIIFQQEFQREISDMIAGARRGEELSRPDRRFNPEGAGMRRGPGQERGEPRPDSAPDGPRWPRQ